MTHFFIGIKRRSSMINLEKLKALILPVLAEMDIELVDLDLRGTRGYRLLRIFIDTETGITIDTCKQVNDAVSELLDTHDLIPERYRLEISSPGVERPLKTERDFRRHQGRRVRVVYQAGENTVSCEGIINAVEPGTVMLESEQGPEAIPIDAIKNAKIMLKW